VNAPEPQPEAADDVASPVVPTRIKARRVLSDEHRQALIDGRRMARHRRAVDEGRARELLAPSLAPSQAAGLPRLVKRAKHYAIDANLDLQDVVREALEQFLARKGAR